MVEKENTTDRGITFGKKRKPSNKGTEFANSRAYVIGINAYSNGIPSLRTAVADAERIGQLLEKSLGYQVRAFTGKPSPSLMNLQELLNTTMPQEVAEDDRVLFYFAGHGITLDWDDGPEGYLVPEDALSLIHI